MKSSSSSSDLALSDFSLMMKEFRDQCLTPEFNACLTEDFRSRWAQHPQLGLWLETAWHVGYQFQLGLLEQLFNRSLFLSSSDLRLHFPSLSNQKTPYHDDHSSALTTKDSGLSQEDEDGFYPSPDSISKKIKPTSTALTPELSAPPVFPDATDFSTSLPFSLSQEYYTNQTQFSRVFHSIIPSLLKSPQTSESLSKIFFKIQNNTKNNSISFNLNIMDCLQLLEIYQQADPAVWNQSRDLHRQTWMAQQWSSQFIPTQNSDFSDAYRSSSVLLRRYSNPFYNMGSWFCFHLLPTSILSTPSSFSLFNTFIQTHTYQSHSKTFYHDSPHGRFMIPESLYRKRPSRSGDPEYRAYSYYRNSTPLITELFNPQIWKSLGVDSIITHYIQVNLLGALSEGSDFFIHASDRPRFDRFRQITQWLQQVIHHGIPSVSIPHTSLHLDIPFNPKETQMDLILGVTPTQLNNLVLSMNPNNLQSDSDIEMIQRQWIECWIEHQPSDHKRKIRADIRKNLKAQQSAQDDASHDADPLLHEIFQAFTGQSMDDDAQGSSQLKQTLHDVQLSSAGWKALHKNTSFQELMLRNLMSSEQWRLRQLSVKQKKGDTKISTKDRELLLEQQRLKNTQTLNMQWMADVLSASAEYGFSTSDTKVLLQLISYSEFSSWVFSQGRLSTSDVISMNEQEWNQWWDGVDVEHRQRQGLWKVWMKDAVDYFSSRGGLAPMAMLDCLRSIRDVQRAEAPHDFFTQLATQYKKTPFRSALKWHDEWVQRVNQQKMETKSDVSWPTPWSQMNATLKEAPPEKVQTQGLSSWLEHLSKVKVQELNSERLLAQEGLLMHHCVGSPSFARESKNQSIIIFHLQHKTHELGCTLTLERGLDQKWVIQQNKGKYNSCVKDPDLLAMTKAIKDQINLYEKIYTPESTKKNKLIKP